MEQILSTLNKMHRIELISPESPEPQDRLLCFRNLNIKNFFLGVLRTYADASYSRVTEVRKCESSKVRKFKSAKKKTRKKDAEKRRKKYVKKRCKFLSVFHLIFICRLSIFIQFSVSLEGFVPTVGIFRVMWG